jgi:amidase
MAWQEICEKRRKRILKQASPNWILSESELTWINSQTDRLQLSRRYLSVEEYQIVELNCWQLVEMLSTRKLSAATVIEAYCHSATVAHQLTNCLSDLLYHEAITTAKRLDEHFRQTGKPVGPLHGLPISVKDNIHVKGTDSCLGVVSLVDIIDNEDSTIVSKIRKLGGIPFCKTIASAATMSVDCESNVFGRTLHPGNTTFIPGSSSGGEASLISLHGSCLGIGTDLGGSIRFPASFQGLYGLKPAAGVIDFQGCTDLVTIIPLILSTVGPMARDPYDLELFMRAVSAEPGISPVSTLMGPKRIAILRDNNVKSISNSILTALDRVQEVLEANGWTVIDWDAHTLHGVANDLIGKAFVTHGYTNITRALSASDEPPPPRLKEFLSGPRSNDLTSLYDLLAKCKDQLMQKFKHYDVEYLISPVATDIGFAFGSPGSSDGSYTCIWNLCNLPTGIFPVDLKSKTAGLQIIGTTDKEIDVLQLLKLLQNIL